MKIIILFSESVHYGMAAASRVMAYAKGLKENGCEVEIIMPYTFVRSPENKFQQSGKYDGVNYKYLQFLSENPFKRYLKGVSHIIANYKAYTGYLKYLAYFIKNRKNYQVVYIYKFGSLLTVLFLLFNRSKLKVSELCEIPFHDLRGKVKIRNRKLREKMVFPLFDAFVVISENLRNYITETAKAKQVIKVPILYQNFFTVSLEKKPETPYFIHSGSLLESKDGIIGIIEAFGKAVEETKIPFHFIFTGYLEYSPDKKKILASIEKYNISDRVIFKGFISREDVSMLQQNASIAIINKPDNEMNFYNFPTKLSEYLISETAVIASEIGELKNYLANDESVYFFEPGNMNNLVEKIKDAMVDKVKREAIARKGKMIAENNFLYSIHGKRLKVFFDHLVNA